MTADGRQLVTEHVRDKYLLVQLTQRDIEMDSVNWERTSLEKE